MQNGVQIISSYYHIPVPIVGLAIGSTFVCIDLCHSGLTSSTIGSVLLSLVPPMAVFFIGLAIKRQLKKSNVLGSWDIESGESSESIASESTESIASKSSERWFNAQSTNECTPLVQRI